MAERQLTGLERELVLQYLRDDNVPVTITESERSGTEGAAVFPVAVKSQQLNVLDKGVVLLRDVPDAIAAFVGKSIRVQFYFNKLGIYFHTEMRRRDSHIYIVVPGTILVAEDRGRQPESRLRAILRFPGEENSGFQIEAFPAPGFEVFGIPQWGAIELEHQKEAKEYIEDFVREEPESGKGVHHIAISRYFVQGAAASDAGGRPMPMDILFVDSGKIVFARRGSPLELRHGEKCSLQLSLPGAPALPPRTIITTCTVGKLYSSKDSAARCAVCNLDNLKEEDARFLYEKSTGNIFE